MRYTVLCVGKPSEPWQRQACAEYLKRLSRYGDFSVEEVPDIRESASGGEGAAARVMRREGEALLKKIRPEDTVIALCVDGRELTSADVAAHLSADRMRGGRAVLVIGGSLGLSEEVVARAQARWSLSRMTLPHALARVVLLEQLYRGCKINAGERYHK